MSSWKMKDVVVEGVKADQREDGEGSTIPVPSEPEDVGVERDLECGVGSTLGRYVIIDELGKGGMGVVYRAYDPRLQREVALKWLRRGQLSERSQARLIREARAMAKLSHPNVVAIYDVEVQAERVVLAMEFVDGKTLRRWLHATPRKYASILQVFDGAGRGLAAAHRAGLLHRDFKPANVMIRTDGRVQVADFGLAQYEVTRSSRDARRSSRTSTSLLDSLDSGLDEEHLDLTREGSVLGTPLYMAPEQHEGGRVDARADQYAFCIALWQALVGTPPFLLARRAGHRRRDLARAKRNGPPPWPRRSGVPRYVVDAISRGLAPRAEDRWPNMEALLEALGHDPWRRRRRWFGFGAAGVGLVAASTSLAAWQGSRMELCSGAHRALASVWNRARIESLRTAFDASGSALAPAAWSRVRQGIDDYVEQWAQLHRQSCEATNLRAEQSAATMDLQMSCLGRARIELDAALEVLSRPDPELVVKSHEIIADLRPLETCETLDILSLEVPPPEAAIASRVEELRGELARARSLRRGGKYDEAMDVLELAEPRARDLDYPPLRLELDLQLGLLHESLGHYDRCQATLQTTLASALEYRSTKIAADASTALVRVLGQRQAKFGEATIASATASGLARRIDPGGVLEAEVWLELGRTLKEKGDYAEARTLLERALDVHEHRGGRSSLELSKPLEALAELETVQGDVETAERLLRRAQRIIEATLGDDHPDLSPVLGGLAGAMAMQGRYDEVEALDRSSLRIAERGFGPDHPAVAIALNNLGSTLITRGQHEEALTLLRRGLAITERVHGPDHLQVSHYLHNLAAASTGLDRHEEAERLHRRALAVEERALGPTHLHVAHTLRNLAVSLHRQGRLSEAEEVQRRGLTILKETMGTTHPRTAEAHASLGSVLFAQAELDDAREQFERALEIFSENDFEPFVVAQAEHGLAQTMARQGAPTSSWLEWARRARVHYVDAGPGYSHRLAEVEALIALAH